MNDTEWDEMVEVANGMGYGEVFTDENRESISNIQLAMIMKYELNTLSISEWVNGFGRYYGSVKNRDYTPMDIEKLQYLMFCIKTTHDRLASDFRRVAIRNVDQNPNMARLEAQAQLMKRHSENYSNKIKEISNAVHTSTSRRKVSLDVLIEQLNVHKKNMEGTFIRVYGIAEEQAKLMANNPQDNSAIKTIRDSMIQVKREIDDLEEELGLKRTREVEDAYDVIQKFYDKTDRFLQDNPQFIEWLCPVCHATTPLAIPKPPEGSIPDKMADGWQWKCPHCNNQIALDHAHPYFMGGILFNEILWSWVTAEQISIFEMAAILDVSPENIIKTAEAIGHPIPDKAKADFAKYDEASRL